MELLLVSLLKASLILALAQLLVLAVPALSAAMKHLLLTAGIAAFVVIPLLALFGPVWELTVETEAPPVVVSAPVDAVPFNAVAPQPPAPQEEPARIPVAAVAAGLWLLIAFAVIARLLRTALHLRSIVAGSVESSPRLLALLDDVRGRLELGGTVRLLRSDRINVPMVWGVRSGTLLMPEIAEEWTDEHLRATFIHELGHLQRLDYVSLALMNLVSAALWFHPQVWIARRRAITEGERACDDLVLTAGERASEYATHLLHVARLLPRREPLAALLAMSRPSQLEGRMLAILSPSTNRQSLGGKSLMISFTAFAALVVPLAFVQLSVQAAAMTPPAAPPARAAKAAVAPAAPRPAAPVAPAKPVTPAAKAAPAARVAPVATPAAAPVPAAKPVHPSEPATPVAPAAPAPAPAVSPAPAVEVLATPAALPAIAPAAVAVEPAPVVEPTGIRILSEADLSSSAFESLGEITAASCTYRLMRAVNTGDTTRNPAEALARTRLLKKAEKKGADAVTNVRCYRYLAIGITCPSGIECTGDAVAFTSGGK